MNSSQDFVDPVSFILTDADERYSEMDTLGPQGKLQPRFVFLQISEDR